MNEPVYCTHCGTKLDYEYSSSGKYDAENGRELFTKHYICQKLKKPLFWKFLGNHDLGQITEIISYEIVVPVLFYEDGSRA